MQIKKVYLKDKNAFNKVAVHPLQSWEWGEFREKAGNKIVRLGIFKGKKLTDAIQVVFSLIPKTKFKIGTVIKGPKPSKEILDALKDLAREENAIFIKLEPNVPVSFKDTQGVNIIPPPRWNRFTPRDIDKNKLIKLLKENGCAPGKTLFTPTTFWINLTPSEEELMKSFHPKTRYNIRVAQRKGVEVIENNSDKAFEKYIELTRETVERQGFYSHTENYHQWMWKYLHKDMIERKEKPIAHLLKAIYQNEIITTWIVFVWHDFLYYPYGASSTKYREVMSSNSLAPSALKVRLTVGMLL